MAFIIFDQIVFFQLLILIPLKTKILSYYFYKNGGKQGPSVSGVSVVLFLNVFVKGRGHCSSIEIRPCCYTSVPFLPLLLLHSPFDLRST